MVGPVLGPIIYYLFLAALGLLFLLWLGLVFTLPVCLWSAIREAWRDHRPRTAR